MIALAVACGGEEETTEESAPPEEAHEHGAEGGEHAEAAQLTNASVMFVGIEDGATLTGPLTDGTVTVHIEMGLEGAEVHAAGEIIAGTGHHHVIVDGEGVPFGTAVPADDTHIHFGGGQTEADLELAPGEHTLTLQFADGAHRSYGPALSSRISITVADEAAAAEAATAEGPAESEDEAPAAE